MTEDGDRHDDLPAATATRGPRRDPVPAGQAGPGEPWQPASALRVPMTRETHPVDLTADFVSTGDQGGLALFVRRLEARRPRAGLIFLHGSLVHSEYYLAWGLTLAQRGIAVWLPDLRGHGRSGGMRGTVGRYPTYTADLSRVVEAFRRTWPDLPLYLGGESFGGLVAFLAAATGAGGLGGLVLSSPAFALKASLSPRQRRLITQAARFLPLLRPLRPMGVAGVAQWPGLPRLVDTDPLVNRRYTLKFLAELLAAQAAALPAAADITCPLCVLLAGQDRVVDNAATRAVLGAVTVPVRLREFPDAWHSLTADVPEALADEVLAFVEATAPPPR
jgi:alpha-beta hydrolase superfamily lysophospholipase